MRVIKTSLVIENQNFSSLLIFKGIPYRTTYGLLEIQTTVEIMVF